MQAELYLERSRGLRIGAFTLFYVAQGIPIGLLSIALPAWMAAGLDDAFAQEIDIANREVLAVGYGSGDAAEAIPMRVARSWREAASRIGFAAALDPQQTLTREQYEQLHDNGQASGLVAPDTGFVIESVGSSAQPGINDEGIEYYRYLS